MEDIEPLFSSIGWAVMRRALVKRITYKRRMPANLPPEAVDHLGA